MGTVQAHRAWCDRERCDERAHRGRLVVLTDETYGPVAIETVQTDVMLRPVVTITADDGEPVVTSLETARAIGQVLSRQARWIQQ